jgi:hypothetical protein
MKFEIGGSGSSGGGGDFEKPALGAHVAVLADVVNLGNQKTKYKYDKGHPKEGEPKYINQCVLFWELGTHVVDGNVVDSRNTEGEYAGQRFVKTQTVTASLYGGWGKGSKAKLFGIVTSLRGGVALTEKQVDDKYDMFGSDGVVGKTALVYLADSEDGEFRYVENVETLQDASKALTAEGDYGPDNYHDWVKEKIAAQELDLSSKPAAKKKTAAALVKEDDSDIPF